MNFEIARFNMLEQQIRPWEVLDQNSLQVMQQIPREEFVPEALKKIAFSDTELPLQHKQRMLAPKIEAKILQAVQIKSTDNVFEVGTGSAYLTALIASIAKTIHSIDIYQDFIDQAQTKLTSFDLQNATFENIDLFNYDFKNKKFDVIIIGGAVSSVPETLKEALTNNGRLFIVTGKSPVMLAKLYTRIAQDQWMEEILFETEIPTLENNESRNFVF